MLLCRIYVRNEAWKGLEATNAWLPRPMTAAAPRVAITGASLVNDSITAEPKMVGKSDGIPSRPRVTSRGHVNHGGNAEKAVRQSVLVNHLLQACEAAGTQKQCIQYHSIHVHQIVLQCCLRLRASPVKR